MWEGDLVSLKVSHKGRFKEKQLLLAVQRTRHILSRTVGVRQIECLLYGGLETKDKGTYR